MNEKESDGETRLGKVKNGEKKRPKTKNRD
jgi:hypothetical protein